MRTAAAHELHDEAMHAAPRNSIAANLVEMENDRAVGRKPEGFI